MSQNFQDRRNPQMHDRRNALQRDRRAAGVGGAMAAAAGLVSAAASAAAEAAGLAGRRVNPIEEEAFWRANYASEPYYDERFSFNDYYAAYRAGWEARMRHPGRSFQDVERDIEADFNWNRGQSMMLWEEAREAARAAWDRVVAG